MRSTSYTALEHRCRRLEKEFHTLRLSNGMLARINFVYYELPVFVLMLQTVSKCRSVSVYCVLFEHCFIIKLFGLMTVSLK